MKLTKKEKDVLIAALKKHLDDNKYAPCFSQEEFDETQKLLEKIENYEKEI